MDRYHIGVSALHANRAGFRRKSRSGHLADFKNMCALRGRMDLWRRFEALGGIARLAVPGICTLTMRLSNRHFAAVEAYLDRMETAPNPQSRARAAFVRGSRPDPHQGPGPSRLKKRDRLLNQAADEGLADILAEPSGDEQ